MTKPMLSTVSEVSAILVAKMIFRAPSGVFINAFAYCSVDYAPYSAARIIEAQKHPTTGYDGLFGKVSTVP